VGYFEDVFFYFIIFNGRPISNEFSGTTGRICTIFSELDQFCIHLVTAQGTLPWQPINVAKSAFFAEKILLSCCHSVRIGISGYQWAALVIFGTVTSEKLLLIFVLL